MQLLIYRSRTDMSGFHSQDVQHFFFLNVTLHVSDSNAVFFP